MCWLFERSQKKLNNRKDLLKNYFLSYEHISIIKISIYYWPSQWGKYLEYRKVMKLYFVSCRFYDFNMLNIKWLTCDKEKTVVAYCKFITALNYLNRTVNRSEIYKLTDQWHYIPT